MVTVEYCQNALSTFKKKNKQDAARRQRGTRWSLSTVTVDLRGKE